MKRRLLGFFGLLLALTVCFSGCSGKNSIATPSDGTADGQTAQNDTGADAETTANDALPLTDGSLLTEGLYVREVFSYTGAYVEDGKNEPCEDICAVRIENSSKTHYRYLRFSVTTSEDTYTFTATTLFAGARMTVLCEEKAAFAGGDVLSAELLAVTPFDEPPTVHTDTLLITYTEGFINVKNLTEETLSDVYVYFKDTDDYGYLGGITYRTSFGDIPAGETTQCGAVNMHQATGRVVFATYAS